MAEPGPEPDSAEIMEAVDDALQGLELEPHEATEILEFANREAPSLLTPDTSYFVLGSYRDPYLKRIRIVQNELNKRLNTYPFLMGDLPELDIDRLPVFRIRFQILATYADYITAVHEQDAGGEVTELGKISETPFFDKSFVLPRDYAWQTRDNLTSKPAVLDAALTVAQSEHATADEIDAELDRIIATARDNGVEITREEIDDEIERREENDEEMTSYSWVHLNEFRLFELHDRCFPWVTDADLRSAVEEVP